MASQRYYLADHESQRKTGPMSTTNCAAASGAMVTDQWSLGLIDPGVKHFRDLTDDFDGGLRMGQVAEVMEDLGVTVQLYDYRDGLKWSKLARMLGRGWFAVVAGDYDVLPPSLKGADYDGYHAVVYHQPFKRSQRVGDPLQHGWLRWPNDLAYQYVKKFDQQTVGGIHAAVMVPRFARLRSEVRAAEVHAAPTTSSPVITIMKDDKRLVTGGTVRGDRVIGSSRWRKVWVPGTATPGYVHWSVTWRS